MSRLTAPLFFAALVACERDPLAGRWQGEDVPIQLTTELAFTAHTEMTFAKGKAEIVIVMKTGLGVDLATLDVRASYETETEVEPHRVTLALDSLNVTAVSGMSVTVDEKNIASGGTLLCFPVAQVEACVARSRELEFSVDGDNLRFFFGDGPLILALKFTRM